jgi:hypothetical protein
MQMRRVRRSVVRGLNIASSVALVFFACSVVDEDGYVFEGASGAGSNFPSPAGSSNVTGGAGPVAGGSSSSRGGTATAPGGGGAAGSGSAETPTASGGRAGGSNGSGGRASIGSSGSPPSSAGTTGAASSSADAGATGAPHEGCVANEICATVSVGRQFPSGVARLAVVLYEAEPVITGESLPWPLATYPVDEVELSPDESFAFQRDFTSPAWGANYTGERYVAVVAFFSNEERQARPGIDYWSVLPAPVAIAPGGVVELGDVQLSPIPIPDDLDTAGHEGAGTVTCVARLHDEPGDPVTCDVTTKTCCIYPILGGNCSSAACAASQLEHDCDGPEDCGEGEVCCGERMQAHRCVAAEACSARRACHIDAECGDASTVCAPAVRGIADVGYCVSADPSTPGDDRPYMVQCYPSALVCFQHCCVDEPQSVYSCEQTCSTLETRVFLFCDGPEDCGQGGHCCRRADGYTTCRPTCAETELVVCHEDTDCPTGQCGANGECSG